MTFHTFGRPLAAAGLALAFALAATAPVSAKFKPVDGYDLLGKTKLKLESFPLPKDKIGYLIKTKRNPVIVTGKNDIALIMSSGGDDDGKWPYRRILNRLLQKACGLRDPKAGEAILASAYKAKSITPPRKLSGSGGTVVHRRYTVVKQGCRITVEIKGARWHLLTTTIRKAA